MSKSTANLMISVVASRAEGDHTFGPDPPASCPVMIQYHGGVNLSFQINLKFAE
jgi:hypothetical protein